jgi:glycosyltransferase involved in cell wall biosynthesis
MQNHTGQLTRALDRRGVVQTVVTTRPPGAPRRHAVGSAEVRRYGLPVRRLRQLYSLPATAMVPWLARDADLIHAHLGEDLAIVPLALGAARRHDLPLVLTVHASLRHTLAVADLRSWVLRHLGGPLEALGERRADAVIALTPRLARMLEEDGLAPGRVHVIPSGVVPAEFATDAPDPWPGLGRPRVVFVGRLARQKGVRTLLAAAGRLRTPGVRLVLVGDGSERPFLEQGIRRAGLEERVTLVGFRAHEEIPGILAHADLLVLPSVYEELGSVLLEALQAGLPIVASDTGGIPDAVGPAGVLVPPGDPAALAEGIDAVLADPERARRLSALARERAKAYDWDLLAERVLDVYARALREHRRHPDARGPARRGAGEPARALRILCVSTLYPPHHTGGYELHCASAVRDLRRHGHDVRVLASAHRHPGVEDGAEPGVFRELVRFPRSPRPTSPRAALLAERHNARVLERHLREFRPDVVSWWRLGELSQSLVERVRRTGVPAVGLVCDAWMLEGPGRDPWARLWRERPRLGTVWERTTGMPTRPRHGAAGEWLFVSDSLRRHVLGAGLELPETGIAHAGIELDLLPLRPVTPPWRGRLLYAGRVTPLKGLDTAVRALALLPPSTSLEVVGDAEPAYRAELERLAAALGVAARVTFEPPRRHAEMAALYADADAVLFPVRWEEPWGLVPLEAMACGTPVIATGTGGSAEYLRAGANALVVRPDSPEELARAVRRLATDPELRRRLAHEGRRTAQAHPAERGNAIVRRRLEAAASERPRASAA